MVVEIASKKPELLFRNVNFRDVQVWSWLPKDEIEESAMQQVSNIASLPPTAHVALMPDCHTGYGMPIGAVLATEKAVVPNAVGVDIACGMIAQRMDLDADAFSHDDGKLLRVLEGIFARVPVGTPRRGVSDVGEFSARQNSQVLKEWHLRRSNEKRWRGSVDSVRERADRQLGTLGSGNHFIEIQADESGQVWYMLHTGSRSFGHGICKHHNAIAESLNKKYYSPLPTFGRDEPLYFLSTETEDGWEYFEDMQFAVRFAEESRERIRIAVLAAFADVFPGTPTVGDPVLTNHNFASLETHLGKELMVHRKGAVRTVHANGGGVLVTIPGSMQTGSYIGMGKINKMSLNTCSHGAGRSGMGRKAFVRANPDLNVKADMLAAGLLLVSGSDNNDEAGIAYKDIENVMGYQTDLVEPVVKLRPLGTVKG